jgi:hypothetical protein
MKEKDRFKDLADLITGEKSLREKEERLREEKKKAIEEQKDMRRRKIVEGKLQLEEDPVQKRDVVQNIKLFEWEAPERYQVKLNSKGFMVILALSLAFIVLLAILGKYFLIAAIVSILFVLYAAGTTKPLIAKHKITKRGVDTTNKLYEWYMLDSFFFAEKGDYYTLVINTKLNFPKVLIMLVNKKDRDAIFVILQKYLLYEEIKKQAKIDKVTYGEYVPLEKL